MPDIESAKKEYGKILEQLSDPELISNTQTPVRRGEKASSLTWEKLLERKAYLEEIIEKGKEIENIKNRIEENKEILKSHEDPELSSLAETEIIQMGEKLKNLEEESEKLLNKETNAFSGSSLETQISGINKDSEESADHKAAIVEIRAGTGGDEAGLFAADLYKMYAKYCQLKSWKMKVLDSRPNELGGIKEIVFEVKASGGGQGVWLSMRHEAGVHRVQRIPTTEKSGRVHTSTASVAVLPKPKKGKIVINSNDLKVDTYKASGPGGQYVNKRMTAVRVTHLPTGLVVTSQTARNLQQNRENALSILEAKLLEKKESEESFKMGLERRSQIGKAQRAEKIRTYNFPQGRITDHRIKKSFHNIEEIMEGKLDSILSALKN